MEFMEQKQDRQMMKALANENTVAEPDQHWSMELEKRHKEAHAQVEMHQRELERWQRMARAVQAALAALHEPMQAPEYEQSEGPDY